MALCAMPVLLGQRGVIIPEVNRVVITMSEDESADETEAEAEALDQQSYRDLTNVARSAREQFDEVDIDTYAREKDELVSDMENAGIEFDADDGVYLLDGEEIDRLEVQTPDSQGSGGSSGPTDSTVLYCLTRAETTEDRVEEIREALESETDFILEESGDGDKYSIVLPAEAQDGYEEPDEDEDEESDESEDDEEPEDDESASQEADEDSEEEADDDASEDEESSDEQSDGSDEDEAEDEDDDEDEDEEEDESDDEDDEVPVEAYRQSLEEKTQNELYEILVELDVDGRSNMDKDEMVDAVAEARVEDDDSPVTAE